MRWLALFAASSLAACGDDAAPVTPDALVCAADEMICADSCTATLTDEQNCGACGNVCGATDACVSGTCMPANIHCARVREADADAPDGTYVNPATHDAFYCDFTNSVTYDEFAILPYDSTQADYTLVTGALATDSVLQKAFLGLFNATGGVRSAATFNSDNCCIQIEQNTTLLVDGKALTPIIEGAYSCGVVGLDRVYQFSLDGSAMMDLLSPRSAPISSRRTRSRRDRSAPRTCSRTPASSTRSTPG